MAYDTLMSFPERFSESILADQLHNINVCFLVPDMRREFGGCAGNIAYNLKLLGGTPLIMATIGIDGAPYLERLAELDISRRYIRTIKTTYTAQAFVQRIKTTTRLPPFIRAPWLCLTKTISRIRQMKRFSLQLSLRTAAME